MLYSVSTSIIRAVYPQVHSGVCLCGVLWLAPLLSSAPPSPAKVISGLRYYASLLSGDQTMCFRYQPPFLARLTINSAPANYRRDTIARCSKRALWSRMLTISTASSGEGQATPDVGGKDHPKINCMESCPCWLISIHLALLMCTTKSPWVRDSPLGDWCQPNYRIPCKLTRQGYVNLLSYKNVLLFVDVNVVYAHLCVLFVIWNHASCGVIIMCN